MEDNLYKVDNEALVPEDRLQHERILTFPVRSGHLSVMRLMMINNDNIHTFSVSFTSALPKENKIRDKIVTFPTHSQTLLLNIMQGGERSETDNANYLNTNPYNHRELCLYSSSHLLPEHNCLQWDKSEVNDSVRNFAFILSLFTEVTPFGKPFFSTSVILYR